MAPITMFMSEEEAAAVKIQAAARGSSARRTIIVPGAESGAESIANPVVAKDVEADEADESDEDIIDAEPKQPVQHEHKCNPRLPRTWPEWKRDLIKGHRWLQVWFMDEVEYRAFSKRERQICLAVHILLMVPIAYLTMDAITLGDLDNSIGQRGEGMSCLADCDCASKYCSFSGNIFWNETTGRMERERRLPGPLGLTTEIDDDDAAAEGADEALDVMDDELAAIEGDDDDYNETSADPSTSLVCWSEEDRALACQDAAPAGDLPKIYWNKWAAQDSQEQPWSSGHYGYDADPKINPSAYANSTCSTLGRCNYKIAGEWLTNAEVQADVCAIEKAHKAVECPALSWCWFVGQFGAHPLPHSHGRRLTIRCAPAVTKLAAFFFGVVSGLLPYAYFAKKTTGDGLGWCIDCSEGEVSHCNKQCCCGLLQCLVQYYLCVFVFVVSLILIFAMSSCSFENIIVRIPLRLPTQMMSCAYRRWCTDVYPAGRVHLPVHTNPNRAGNRPLRQAAGSASP